MNLNQIEIGKSKRIISFRPVLNKASEIQEAVLRLYEMGLVPGTQIQVLRKAPFNGPIVVKVMGYDLCLRSEYAAMIEVA